MFKKLKDKITEEVKISPQRFQQLTQSVSDKLQGTSAPEENMFSIGEDDENTNTSNVNSTDHGFSSVNLVSPSSERSRRLSNSSMASDISFLPRYEASSLYHLQSDLDVSASELEDNTSQSSSQFGRLSKEQIYSAFQKSQMRYHKYRGRYTDLARHYKELEKEIGKMKSVLVETQDKSIRRVNELKEQCALEQKAKAHLENALRDELDEKQLKIDSLQTKIGLMNQGQNHTNNLVDVEDRETTRVDAEKLEQLTKYLNDARSEIEALNSKIQEYKASAIVYQSKEQQFKAKIASLEKDIASFSEREEENNIKLAENKMELHKELLGKDSEISRLKAEIETLKGSQEKSVKMENLQSQNTKLIEKLENMTAKCNTLENELLKLEKYKMDISHLSEENIRHLNHIQEVSDENSRLQNVIGTLKIGLSACQDNLQRLSQEKQGLIETIQQEKQSYESQIEHLRESAKKGLFTLEHQISERIRTEYWAKEANLKANFEKRLKEISENNQTVADIYLRLGEKDNILTQLSEELEDVKKKLASKENQYRELENNHLELIEESSQLRSMVNGLGRQISDTNNEDNRVYEEKIGRLQANIKTLQDEVDHLQKYCDDKEKIVIQLSKDILNLQTANTGLSQKSRLMEEKEEAAEMEITENNLLAMKVQNLERERKELLDSFEVERKLFNKVLEEHNDLKVLQINVAELEQSNKILEEKVIELKGYLNERENALVEVNKAKLRLEEELVKYQELVRISEEREEAIDLEKSECGLLQMKLQQLQKEKAELLMSFEKEREMYDQMSHTSNDDTQTHKDGILQENVELAKENLDLKRINQELSAKVRLIEERDMVVELESTECNLLKLKVQQLEQEKVELLKSIETERELFNRIMAEHKELKVKEERINELEGVNESLTAKLVQLKQYLNNKEETIVRLHKDNLADEQGLAKLNESLQLKELQFETQQIESTECDLLELKLKALEEENRNLLNSFELERASFEDALTKGAHNSSQLDELNRQVLVLQQEKDDMAEAFRQEKLDIIDSYEVLRKNFQMTDAELRKLSEENVLLKEEKDNLNSRLKEETELLGGQVGILKEEVNRLQETNEKLRKEIDQRQEKLDEFTTTLTQLKKDLEHSEEKYKNAQETLSKVKSEKKEALAKIKAMQQELDKNNEEISSIRKSLEMVDKLYNEAKTKHSSDLEVLETTRRELNDLKNEKIKLEQELQKKTDEWQFKRKEMSVVEQQFTVLSQDKEALIQENKQLRDKMEEMAAECDKLRSLTLKVKELDLVKNQNEALQTECNKLNKEISELKVRINQLESDNRHVNEEHEKIIGEMEGHKAKCEFLENEKSQLVKLREEVETERDSLRVAVTDLTEKLEKNREERTNHPDLVQIQKDFLEIKDKCDRLHLENRNLKAEYSKLEEQCNSFTKVKKELETQLAEVEGHYNEVLHEKQLLQDEIQELKISPVSHHQIALTAKQETIPLEASNGPSHLQKEVESLRETLTQYKSLDMSNKSSIDFYENELQKLKNKNEKLNRKLDETLVTLNHCAELSTSTEVEYLKNVLYNYMLGKESLVLARVIAAVCKFDPSQTEAVLQKEQQKQTLLGQLGLL